MALVLEIAFVAALVVVAASLVAVAFARVPERLLLGMAVALGILALAGAVVAGLEIAEGTEDEELLLVTAGGLLVSLPADKAAVLEARFLAESAFLARVGRVEEGSGVTVS